MATFLETATRIMTELRRSNMLAAAKQAINDAIQQEASVRYYFNEMTGITIPMVAGTEYYSDQGLTEIDNAYYTDGVQRGTVDIRSKLAHDATQNNGQDAGDPPDFISRVGERIRVYPVPTLNTATLVLDGYGKLTPWPLTLDDDTNAWLTSGEMLIRNAAKAILLRDVIRDLGEAAAFEAIAQDQRSRLEQETTVRIGTGRITPTRW